MEVPTSEMTMVSMGVEVPRDFCFENFNDKKEHMGWGHEEDEAPTQREQIGLPGQDRP